MPLISEYEDATELLETYGMSCYVYGFDVVLIPLTDFLLKFIIIG